MECYKEKERNDGTEAATCANGSSWGYVSHAWAVEDNDLGYLLSERIIGVVENQAEAKSGQI